MSHITQPEGGAPASSQTPALFSAKRVRIQHIARAKAEGIPLTMLTAYDALTAPILEAAGVDMLLVGDSLGNVILGHSSTLPVTLEDMERATAAVARSTSRAMIVADLPFGTYEDTVEHAFASASRLMKAGAHAVKLEGGRSRAHIIAGLVSAGIPVCAHLGYTPQSENTLGGPRMQGRGAGADALRRDAAAVEQAGAAGRDHGVSQGRALGGAGQDRQTDRVGGQLAQEPVANATADHVDDPHFASGQLGGLAHGTAVGQGQGVVDAAHVLADATRPGLPGGAGGVVDAGGTRPGPPGAPVMEGPDGP